MSGWLPPRLRSVGVPKPNLEVLSDGWIKPDLPPLPPEVATEVVRFARWRLKEYVSDDEGDRG